MTRGLEQAVRPAAAAGPASWRRRIGVVAHEPLVQFLAAGLALFLAQQAYDSRHAQHRIVVTRAHVAQLAKGYALQFGDAPDPATLEALVRRDLHDEVLFRQGMALKLDQDDEIVRRRIVQKMQFLMQDLNAPREPTDAALQAWYDAHAARYATPAQTTFSHIFFSSDGGDAAARARAEAVRKSVADSVTRAPERGDPFPDLYDFANFEPDQIWRLFGHTPFADAVMTTAPRHWAGPFRSAYGWHLIYVDSRAAQARPPLAQVREAVRTDYLQQAQDAANAQAFDRLARDYDIVREDRR